jgi:serine/threonine protein kinase
MSAYAALCKSLGYKHKNVIWNARHLNYLNPRLLCEGHEGCIYIYDSRVVKIYSANYFKYNEDYNRLGEGYFLKLYTSNCFISLLEETPFYIVMPYFGEPLGDQCELKIKNFNKEKLCVWLLKLKEELVRLGIKHRDINPSNILYHKDRDDFRLIDFGWAINSFEKDDETTKCSYLNPYAQSDEEAIDKIIMSVSNQLN